MINLTKKQKSASTSRSRRLRSGPAGWGVVAFVAFCLVVLVWDAGGSAFNLTGVDVSQLPQPEELTPSAPAQAALSTDVEPAAPPDEEGELSAEQTLAAALAAYRLDREQSRAQELTLLQTVLDDPQSSAQAREQAEQRRLAIAAAVDSEVLAESLLDAKGMGDTVVLLGAAQATVICSLQLDAVTATQIAQIVSESCGVGFENVVIVNR